MRRHTCTHTSHTYMNEWMSNFTLALKLKYRNFDGGLKASVLYLRQWVRTECSASL